MSKVLCIGDSCADIVIPYGELKSGREASVSFSCGGSGANSVYALAKLNVPVSLCARAGKDLYGREMKRQLKEAGADTKYFILDEDTVSTQILVVIDENRDRFPLLMPKELRDAHTKNDIAVMKAYGFNIREMSEADCVAALMKMYQELTEGDTAHDNG